MNLLSKVFRTLDDYTVYSGPGLQNYHPKVQNHDVKPSNHPTI